MLLKCSRIGVLVVSFIDIAYRKRQRYIFKKHIGFINKEITGTPGNL